ncbi:tripartite tricarboxylate transporter TctB family protein [Haloterrigena sp. SYSU A558-1]|uniref:Tripartite tricarboxylate transporter TctB family protein n=1 Tax=Haloterrigena gelatinilytica TaxID=2741724 RepID=A0A8J8GKI7_9EURY|nr:tripartite tricarboxylate transporter TctB family protein [Haloterrigena gelatinilytica]NUC73220.1 tripartite tricarboxylate transporter TctB family protein [Haloterrigena gelatinilytica]
MIIKKMTRNIRQIDAETVKSNPLSIAFILFSLAVIYHANQFPDGGELGPGFFPIMLSAGIILFAIVDLTTDDETELDLSDVEVAPIVAIGGILFAYVFLMKYTGFLVGTMLFLPIVLYYSDVRSKLLIAALSIGFPILLFYVFSRIFMVRLPESQILPVSRLLPQLPLVVF